MSGLAQKHPVKKHTCLQPAPFRTQGEQRACGWVRVVLGVLTGSWRRHVAVPSAALCSSALRGGRGCRRKKTVKKVGFYEDFLLGGVAAGISKTVAAPIERVKLLVQNQDEMIKSGRLATPYKGTADCFR